MDHPFRISFEFIIVDEDIAILVKNTKMLMPQITKQCDWVPFAVQELKLSS